MTEYKSAFDLLNDKHKAKLLKERFKLVSLIVDRIKLLDITQKKAAEIMEVTQPRVSNLCNGRISIFSFDMLFIMHSKLVDFKDGWIG